MCDEVSGTGKAKVKRGEQMAVSRILKLVPILLVAVVGVAAYTQLVHVVHIEIGPSGKIKSVWEEDKESPIVEIPQLYSYEQLGKKLFGKENPTILDAVKRVLEEKAGREKVKELLKRYGKIYFCDIGIGYSGLGYYYVEVVAHPLAKPELPIVFEFRYNESADAFSLEIAEYAEDGAGIEWYYRNVTDEELKELLSLLDVSRYKNTFFVACEASESLSLKGFAWEDRAINISGFKACKGVRISIVYLYWNQGKEKLDERVDEIMVIGR